MKDDNNNTKFIPPKLLDLLNEIDGELNEKNNQIKGEHEATVTKKTKVNPKDEQAAASSNAKVLQQDSSDFLVGSISKNKKTKDEKKDNNPLNRLIPDKTNQKAKSYKKNSSSELVKYKTGVLLKDALSDEIIKNNIECIFDNDNSTSALDAMIESTVLSVFQEYSTLLLTEEISACLDSAKRKGISIYSEDLPMYITKSIYAKIESELKKKNEDTKARINEANKKTKERLENQPEIIEKEFYVTKKTVDSIENSPTLNIHKGHRTRMRNTMLNSGTDLASFDDIKLLELLLSATIPQRDTNPLAHCILDYFGSLDAVLNAGYAKVFALNGLTAPSATVISVIQQFANVAEMQRNNTNIRLLTPNLLKDYFAAYFSNLKTEAFVCAFLSESMRPIGIRRIIGGHQDAIDVNLHTITNGMDVFNTNKVVLAHNHLFGSARPSREDIISTNNLINGLSLIGGQVIDHIILTPFSSYSLVENKSSEIVEYNNSSIIQDTIYLLRKGASKAFKNELKND